MATRNLTSKFDAIRSQIHVGHKRPRDYGGSSTGRDGLLDSSDSSDDRSLGLGIDIHTMPPQWVDIVDNIHKDTAKAKDNIKTLQKLHAARLKVSFGDEVIAEQERDIEILTQEVTRLLKRSEGNVKKIASVGNTGQLSQQERVRLITHS